MYFHNFSLSVRKIIVCICIISNFVYVNAQLSVHGSPESFAVTSKSELIIPVKILDAIDTAKQLAEDNKVRISNRYGVVQQVNINIKTQGVKTEIPGRGYIWQYKIQSPQTYSLGLHFSVYFIPEGASVYLYNDSHSRLSGGFTKLNNKDNHELSIADFKGDNVIIEYFEPYKPEFEGELVIGSVSQSYRNIFKTSVSQSEVGEIGINCPLGADWQNVKHAVCFLTCHDNLYEYLCTGFLVNNVRNDGTPYFQTANHCISTQALASTLITYFNYENSTCTSNDASLSESLSGSTLIASNAYSDFVLLLLTEGQDSAKFKTYFPYFAGWDATGASPLSGTCIHDPGGDPKSIATDIHPVNSDPSSIEWTENGNYLYTSAPNTHWLAIFTSGATQPGSSGSPLFDQNQHVVGQLHGGGENSDSSDFGKFSLSYNYWSLNSSQLKAWLDPDNTGTTVLDGIFLNVKPVASFQSSLTNVCPKSDVLLSNTSQYASNYSWTITPSTFNYINSTDSTSANPQVAFTDSGKYSIKLKVSNLNGIDSISKPDYINVGKLIVKLSNIPNDSIICGPSLINYPIVASGAASYTYNLEAIDKINYTIGADSIILSLIPSVKKYGSFNTWLVVTGIQETDDKQGKCQTTDSVLLKISMPPNDDVDNALNLYPGQNIPYSNFCASVQLNEPQPLLTSCNSLTSWCPGGGYIQNTLWFTFPGPVSSKVTINTQGFNDRIALYEADSAAAILTGQYTLIAANDGSANSDGYAKLTDIPVVPYKTYWLQVDGYKGSTGTVIIDLITNDLDIFPNPTSGQMNVYMANIQGGPAKVEIYSGIGALVYLNRFDVTALSNHISFDLSSLASGLYTMRVTINGTTITKKFIIAK